MNDFIDSELARSIRETVDLNLRLVDEVAPSSEEPTDALLVAMNGVLRALASGQTSFENTRTSLAALLHQLRGKLSEESPDSCHTISLINFTKIFAVGMERVLPLLIPKDHQDAASNDAEKNDEIFNSSMTQKIREKIDSSIRMIGRIAPMSEEPIDALLISMVDVLRTLTSGEMSKENTHASLSALLHELHAKISEGYADSCFSVSLVAFTKVFFVGMERVLLLLPTGVEDPAPSNVALVLDAPEHFVPQERGLLTTPTLKEIKEELDDEPLTLLPNTPPRVETSHDSTADRGTAAKEKKPVLVSAPIKPPILKMPDPTAPTKKAPMLEKPEEEEEEEKKQEGREIFENNFIDDLGEEIGEENSQMTEQNEVDATSEAKPRYSARVVHKRKNISDSEEDVERDGKKYSKTTTRLPSKKTVHADIGRQKRVVHRRSRIDSEADDEGGEDGKEDGGLAPLVPRGKVINEDACQICGEVARNPSTHVVQKHLKQPRFKCPQCEHGCSSIGGIKSHIKRIHSNAQDKRPIDNMLKLAVTIQRLQATCFPSRPVTLLRPVISRVPRVVCKMCNIQVPRDMRTRHVHGHHLKELTLFECPLCEYSSNFGWGRITDHIKWKHPKDHGKAIPISHESDHLKEITAMKKKCFPGWMSHQKRRSDANWTESGDEESGTEPDSASDDDVVRGWALKEEYDKVKEPIKEEKKCAKKIVATNEKRFPGQVQTSKAEATGSPAAGSSKNNGTCQCKVCGKQVLGSSRKSHVYSVHLTDCVLFACPICFYSSNCSASKIAAHIQEKHKKEAGKVKPFSQEKQHEKEILALNEKCFPGWQRRPFGLVTTKKEKAVVAVAKSKTKKTEDSDLSSLSDVDSTW